MSILEGNLGRDFSSVSNSAYTKKNKAHHTVYIFFGIRYKTLVLKDFLFSWSKILSSWMFGETEVNLFYLLIAAIFPLCSLPIHTEKNSSQRRTFIKNTKISVFCGGLKSGQCFWLAWIWNAHVQLNFRHAADILMHTNTLFHFHGDTVKRRSTRRRRTVIRAVDWLLPRSLQEFDIPPVILPLLQHSWIQRQILWKVHFYRPRHRN